MTTVSIVECHFFQMSTFYYLFPALGRLPAAPLTDRCLSGGLDKHNSNKQKRNIPTTWLLELFPSSEDCSEPFSAARVLA